MPIPQQLKCNCHHEGLLYCIEVPFLLFWLTTELVEAQWRFRMLHLMLLNIVFVVENKFWLIISSIFLLFAEKYILNVKSPLLAKLETFPLSSCSSLFLEVNSLNFTSINIRTLDLFIYL